MKQARNIRSILEQAMALHQQGEIARAEDMYREVLASDPVQPNAWHLLGCAAWQRGDLAPAEDMIQKAIKIHGTVPTYYNNLGGVLRQKGDLVAAIAAYEKALQLDPTEDIARKGLAECLHRHGLNLSHQRRWEEAKATYERVLKLDPANIPTLNNIATIVQHQNDRPAAQALYHQALEIEPDNLLLRYNRGICYLIDKKLEEGWADFTASEPHWRNLQDKRGNLPWMACPLWDGGDLRGKKILLWGDQGIGDEIIYASLVPEMVERGALVTIECSDRLVPLFERSFPGIQVVQRVDSPLPRADFDCHAPWMWLARCLRPHRKSFPDRPSFLRSDPDLTARLRARYKAFGKKHILGISWFTGSAAWGQQRSLPLASLLKTISLSDTLLIDLQYGDTEAAWRDAQKAFPDLAFYHDPDIDQFQNMDSFAAQVAACDSVLTISNTTSHVAGALGVPAVILMSDIGLTWYWFADGEDCPWYPSLKLIRPDVPDRLKWAGRIVRQETAQDLHQQGARLAAGDHWEGAREAWRKALEKEPGRVATLDALAELELNNGDLVTARTLLDQVLAFDPQHFVARFNRGICALCEGQLMEGWDDLYQSAPRWIAGMDRRQHLPWPQLPLWDGSDLKGKKLLIWGDPGLGDEILFASMIPDLLSKGAEVTLECTDRLAPIFARSFPEIKIMARQAMPPATRFDFQMPGLLLGRWLRQEFSAFPGKAYLRTNPGATAALRARYAAFGKKRVVGLSWHSKTQHWGAHRRMGLMELLAVLPQDDTLYLDLQYGATEAERAEAAPMYPNLLLHHDPVIDQMKDMDAFGSQVAACDAVISIANTTPHVAGGLSIPTIVLLPSKGITWYWQMKEGDCPWYQAIRRVPIEGLNAETLKDNLLKALSE